MASKLKIVEVSEDGIGADESAGIVQSAQSPSFDPAPTRKRRAGWTAERQRRFIDHLSLRGAVGEACASVGIASSSAYRLRNKAGAESFARAWDAALSLSTTWLSAIAFDRAVNGRVERFYKNGELVMERRLPSDYLLTWLLARLDPLRFGSPSAKAQAAATGDPREQARNALPTLTRAFTDIAPDECEVEPIDYLDGWLGETGSGEPIEDYDR